MYSNTQTKNPDPSFSSETDSVTSSESEEEEEVGSSNFKKGFDNQAYWLKRYDDEFQNIGSGIWYPFEWYVSWDILKPYMLSYISKCEKVLYFGCGTSTLGIDMSIAGAREVVNIDISKTVIEKMKEKEKDYSNLIKNKIKWIVKDITTIEMWCKDNQFDAVVDKGTIDSFCCSDIAAKILTEVFRGISKVLKPNGYFIVISNGSEEVRSMFFDNPIYRWTLIKIIQIPKPQIQGSFYYMYIYQRNEN
ncbi:hypothetical protein M9Y10_042874 [Tritrichomonas musculus]|uniref:Methyltransferase domain-containing protein n=1 Tax=Tritrichomonas musculus TaxID=1915356 RepID=A0ABR2K0Y5_9EUKA